MIKQKKEIQAKIVALNAELWNLKKDMATSADVDRVTAASTSMKARSRILRCVNVASRYGMAVGVVVVFTK